jgi:hypothetical protein
VDEDTLYVDAAAAPGGDGSAGRPFSTIQAGADAAGARGGGLVAIASGTYTESLALGSRHDGVTLAGRCAEGVRVDAAGIQNSVVVELVRQAREARPRVTLDSLTLTGGTRGGVLVASADLVGRRLHIEQNENFGVFLERASTTLSASTIGQTRWSGRYGSGVWASVGSRLALTDVIIEDAYDGIFAQEADEMSLERVRIHTTTGGPCVLAIAVGSLEGDDVTLEKCTKGGLYVVEQTNANFRDLTVRDAARVDNDSGYGIAVGMGGRLFVDGLDITGSEAYGAYVINGDSTLEIRNGEITGSLGHGLHVAEGGRADDASVPSVRLEDVRLANNGFDGAVLADGAQLVAKRVEIVGNGNTGLQVANASTRGSVTHVELQDVRIAGTLQMDPWVAPVPGGYGLYATGDVTIQGSNVVVEENRVLGIALENRSELELEDCVVSHTLPDVGELYGWGMQAASGAAARLDRCVVEGNHGNGVSVTDDGTRLDLVDTRVIGTVRTVEPESASLRGSGVSVWDGATATLDRVTIDSNPAHGLIVSGAASSATVTETEIRNTYQTTAGLFGRGATVSRGGQLRLSTSTLTGNVEAGVLAHGANSRVDLDRCVIEDTRRGRQGRLALGLGTAAHGTLHATDVEVRGTEGPGAYLYFDGFVRLERADLHDNTFAGAAVLGDGELALVESRVYDNMTDPDLGGGVGVIARSIEGEPIIRIEGVRVESHTHAALWFDGPGSYTILDSNLTGGEGVPRGTTRLHGNAVVGLRGIVAASGPHANGLYVAGNELSDSLGPAVLLDAAAMTQVENDWSGNATDVLQQRCEQTSPLLPGDVADIPSVTLCPPGASLIDTSIVVPRYEPGDISLTTER